MVLQEIKACYIFVSRMKNRTLYIKKKFIASIFLLLIGGIIFNSTFFLHTHRTPLGKIVVHAHPFSKSAEGSNPLTQHEHNKIDLDQLSSIDHFTLNSSTFTIDYNPKFESEILCKPNSESSNWTCHIVTTRGPPSLFYKA